MAVKSALKSKSASILCSPNQPKLLKNLDRGSHGRHETNMERKSA